MYHTVHVGAWKFTQNAAFSVSIYVYTLEYDLNVNVKP